MLLISLHYLIPVIPPVVPGDGMAVLVEVGVGNCGTSFIAVLLLFPLSGTPLNVM